MHYVINVTLVLVDSLVTLTIGRGPGVFYFSARFWWCGAATVALQPPAPSSRRPQHGG
jgi:hypothetical protein